MRAQDPRPLDPARFSWGAWFTLYLFLLCVFALVLIMPTFFILALRDRPVIAPSPAQIEAAEAPSREGR